MTFCSKTQIKWEGTEKLIKSWWLRKKDTICVYVTYLLKTAVSCGLHNYCLLKIHRLKIFKFLLTLFNHLIPRNPSKILYISHIM